MYASFPEKFHSMKNFAILSLDKGTPMICLFVMLSISRLFSIAITFVFLACIFSTTKCNTLVANLDRKPRVACGNPTPFSGCTFYH